MRKTIAGLIVLTALLTAGMAQGQEKLLPPGPGRAEVIAACSNCHGLQAVLHNHLTADEWQDTVAQMQMEGAFMRQEDIPAMVGYLSTHFGRQPASPTPPAPATK